MIPLATAGMPHHGTSANLTHAMQNRTFALHGWGEDEVPDTKKMRRTSQAKTLPKSSTEFAIAATTEAASKAGLLSGKKSAQIIGRVHPQLLAAAKKASGLDTSTELLNYALAKVATEDNYGEKLLELEGTVPKGFFGED